MDEPTKEAVRRQAYYTAYALIVVTAAILRFAYVGGDYTHPDEPIPQAVVDYMASENSLDTNWANADLPERFKYDQYNFSSYHLALRAFSYITDVQDLLTYRYFSAICATLLLALLPLIPVLRRNREACLYTALFVAVAPILVQDAHYARPEAFLTLLTFLLVLLCWPRDKLRYAALCAAALLVGFLVACKVSMLFFVWMPLVPVLHARITTGRPRNAGLAGNVALAAICIAAGFATGAPGAVVNPTAYVNGLRELVEQYAGTHPGHSLTGGGMVYHLLAGYLGSTLGWPIFAFFLVGLVWNVKNRAWVALILLYLPFLAFAAYFSTRSVFFERNLSHVIPFYLAGAAWAISHSRHAIANRLGEKGNWTPVAAALVILVAIAVPARCTYKLVCYSFSDRWFKNAREYQNEIKAKYRHEIFEAGLFATPGLVDEVEKVVRSAREPFILLAYDIGDEVTDENLRLMSERFNVRDIGTYKTLFPHVPPCTLHTYNSATMRYYLVFGMRSPH